MLLEPVDPNERFRSRRRQARRRRAIRRTAALAVVALAAAGTTLGARFLTERDAKVAGQDAKPAATNSAPAPARAERRARGATPAATNSPPAQPTPEPRTYPVEMRGVHVTMSLASLQGKIDQY